MSLALPSHLRRGVGQFPPPAEFADAVETYARKSGRHAVLKFVPPPLNCWVIEFTLKPNDPGLAGVQAGTLEEAAEIVYLWRPSTAQETYRAGRAHLVGYKLDELGVTGMIEYLEKTDTFSGRGQYASHSEAAKDQADKGEKAREKAIADAHQNVRDIAEDRRRSINNIPYLRVGIDLKTPPESAAGANDGTG